MSQKRVTTGDMDAMNEILGAYAVGQLSRP